MQSPQRFQDLPEYAFPRLRALLDAHKPGAEPTPMSIGEPRHAPPPFLERALADAAEGWGRGCANASAYPRRAPTRTPISSP